MYSKIKYIEACNIWTCVWIIEVLKTLQKQGHNQREDHWDCGCT